MSLSKINKKYAEVLEEATRERKKAIAKGHYHSGRRITK